MFSKQPVRSYDRLPAALLVGGAAFLLWRTIVLISTGTLDVYVPWVGGLLVLEAAVDLAALGLAARWLVSRRSSHRKVTLQATVAVVVVHALRVAIFVFGRTGPWIDFDIRPEERLRYAETWSWTDVAVAGSMATLSVCVLLAVWFRVRHSRSQIDARSPTHRFGSPETASRGRFQ